MTTERTRRLAAVFFADIVGYTDLSSRDEESALAVVDELQRCAREEVESRGGRIVKFVGDAVLTVFDSADAAVRSALALQESFASSDLVGEKDCALRIGVHLGEVVEADDGDVYGDGVNVASRIEGQAEAGQVVVSEDVHRLLRQQAAHSFNPFGPVTLKGVAEPMWLYAVEEGGTESPVARSATLSDSSGLYKLVTRHWMKVAPGAVGVVIAGSFLLPNLITGASFQAYVFAWAASTAGLWFLFDKAEVAISARHRQELVGWLRVTEFRSSIEAIPQHFALLFDNIFGRKHLSLRCFFRSALASFLTVIALTGLYLGITWDQQTNGGVISPRFDVASIASLLVYAAVANVVPDYLSLLETRWAIRLHRMGVGPLFVLLGDVLATALISTGVMWVLVALVWIPIDGWLMFGGSWSSAMPAWDLWLYSNVSFEALFSGGPSFGWGTGQMPFPRAIFFYSGFLTSVWLWLYAASVMASRILLRMNSGVGFLLRATDVERQPFRSMGFVSVLIVSALFALGLPLVLL